MLAHTLYGQAQYKHATKSKVGQTNRHARDSAADKQGKARARASDRGRRHKASNKRTGSRREEKRVVGKARQTQASGQAQA